MQRPFLALFLALFLPAVALAERPVLRARAPALSPDGSRIAFTYRGDIWVVAREGGRALRLTNHPAYDAGAAWSPDGTRIAFSSIRHDRYDVFLVDATGGTPRRLTWHSGHDLVEDWYDDATVLIRTSRFGSSDLALVPLAGGTPRRLTRTFLDGEMYARVVPGGDEILISDKSAYRYRRPRFSGSSASDIWSLRIRGEGPRWRRIVDSEFSDLLPNPGADGRVWFVSNRSGAPNVWSVPLAGGEATSHTAYAGRGIRRLEVSRDGRWAAFDHEDRIHVMALPDGTPRPVEIVLSVEPTKNPVEHRTFTSGAAEYAVSPDQKLLAFVVRGEVFVGPAAGGGLARNVSRSVGREAQIAWGPDSRTLYFVSDRDGNREIYRADLIEETLDRLTETPVNEAWPWPSPDGKRLVWISGTEALVVAPEVPGEVRRRSLDRRRRFAALGETPLPEGLSAEDVSRLADLATRIADGEEPPPDLAKDDVPFLVRAMGASDPESDEGRRRLLRLSAALRKATGYPEADPDPDRHDADTFRNTALHWSRYWLDRRAADKDIVFVAPDGFKPPRLSEPEPEAKELRVESDLADMGLWGSRSYDWSPDSCWLAFIERGPAYRTDIRVLDTTDGVVRPVTAHPSARHPRFSGDGQWLSFVSNAPEDDDLFMVRLGAPSRSFPDDELRDALSGEESKKKGKKGGGEPPATEILFDRITERAVQVSGFSTGESEPVLSPDGKTIYFTSDLGDSRELWSYPTPHADGPKRLKSLTKGERPTSVRLSADGKRLYYLSSGRVRSVATSGGSGKSHGFRAEMRIDRSAELRYVLDEALWLLGTWFYDPDLHGADWPAISEHYRSRLADASPGLDFESLLDDLCAELDASHLGASGGADGGESEPETGYLGLDLDETLFPLGRFVVDAVLADGPSAHPDVHVSVGDEILAVNGTPLGRDVNLYALLRRTVGRRAELGLRRVDGSEEVVTVKPCGGTEARTLRYERWVRERREMVDAWSNGRLAYLHVRSMNGPELVRFRRESRVLTRGKEGAIIDVRYNGGGWTAVHILDTLARRPYVMRAFRLGSRVSENVYRDHGLEIPLVALTNHASFSNAEIFSEGFRRLELGPVVGVPTAGGVIGTGSWTLLNGMRLRRPSWSAWTLDGENLEGHGRPVTHRVENRPGVEGHAEDAQLRKAVELLR